MSWHDLRNIAEPEEDRALRAELRDMLGLPQAAGTAAPGAPRDLTALAQSLHAEAIRRRRAGAPLPQAAPARRGFLGLSPRGRAALMSAAAAVAVAASLASMGTWGARLKQREDALAAKTKDLDLRQSRMEEAMRAAKESEAQPILQASGQTSAKPKGKKGEDRSGELVKPEERPTRLDNANEQYRVKDSR
jgi:hypothetical protein